MAAKASVKNTLKTKSKTADGKLILSGSYTLKVGAYQETVLGKDLSPVSSLRTAKKQAEEITTTQMKATLYSAIISNIFAVVESSDFSKASEKADKAIRFMKNMRDICPWICKND